MNMLMRLKHETTLHTDQVKLKSSLMTNVNQLRLLADIHSFLTCTTRSA